MKESRECVVVVVDAAVIIGLYVLLFCEGCVCVYVACVYKCNALGCFLYAICLVPARSPSFAVFLPSPFFVRFIGDEGSLV